jgi:hypothetical protein
VGILRVVLDHGDYSRLDSEMRIRGFSTTILGAVDDEPITLQLPPGHYWHAEPSDDSEMRNDAVAALELLNELGAQVVATAGPSAWHGLLPRQ